MTRVNGTGFTEKGAAAVTVNIHKTHRQFTGGKDVVQVEGITVGDCLQHLIVMFPGMKGALFDGRGKLRNFIEIYINLESAYPDELRKPVRAGDELHITILLAGG